MPAPPTPLPNSPLPPGILFPQEMYDQLEGIVSTFLGYRPDAAELEDFPFLIYNFIIKSLRLKDGLRGSAKFLLKRFLMGPQETWVRIYQRTGKLQTLYDPEVIDADYLPGLRKLVGFGDDLIGVVTEASEIELRRIIAGAVDFWRQRWLDSGIVAAIRLVTGNRYKVRDYFDFRFIVGETMILEDMENQDPNMLSVSTLSRFQQGTDGVSRFGANPTWFKSTSVVFELDDVGGFIVITGSVNSDDIYKITGLIDSVTVTVDPPMPAPAETDLTWFVAFPNDEFITEIRIVDELTGEGELNRPLLKKLLDVQRPNSERFNLIYVDFLDQFTTPFDSGQWEEQVLPGGGLTTFIVDEGIMTIEDAGVFGGVWTNRPSAFAWKDYSFKSKVALGSSTGTFGLGFLVQDEQNGYVLGIEYTGFGTGIVYLGRVDGLVLTKLTADIPFPDLNPETYWTYTIEVFDMGNSSDLNIRLLIDGNLIADIVTVATWFDGNLYFQTSGGTKLWISETEMWQYPLDIERVGPNP